MGTVGNNKYILPKKARFKASQYKDSPLPGLLGLALVLSLKRLRTGFHFPKPLVISHDHTRMSYTVQTITSVNAQRLLSELLEQMPMSIAWLVQRFSNQKGRLTDHHHVRRISPSPRDICRIDSRHRLPLAQEVRMVHRCPFSLAAPR